MEDDTVLYWQRGHRRLEGWSQDDWGLPASQVPNKLKKKNTHCCLFSIPACRFFIKARQDNIQNGRLSKCHSRLFLGWFQCCLCHSATQGHGGSLQSSRHQGFEHVGGRIHTWTQCKSLQTSFLSASSWSWRPIFEFMFTDLKTTLCIITVATARPVSRCRGGRCQKGTKFLWKYFQAWNCRRVSHCLWGLSRD